MNNIIITGASKGIGLAIYENLKNNPDNQLFLIARNFDFSETKNTFLFKRDLTKLNNIKNIIENIFKKINLNESQRIVLINNAGTLTPMKFSGKEEDEEIINNINLNLLAPMILTSNFIKKPSEFKKEKKIINISSGAGKHPYAGWSCYTTAKAGLDMFTRSVALEQSLIDNGIKIISFAPGIVETDMQKQIRNTSKKDFPLVDKFLEIKKYNLANSPQNVAKVIRKLIFNDFKSGDITDISSFD